MSAIAKALAEFRRADVLTLIRALETVSHMEARDDLDKARIRVVKSTIIQLAFFGKIVGDSK